MARQMSSVKRQTCQTLGIKRQGAFHTAWQRFASNRLAVPGLLLVLLLVIMALAADDWFIAMPLGRAAKPLLARVPYDKIFVGPARALPSASFWLGTDTNGRDLYSRIVYGARVSLGVGLLAQVPAVLIGIPLGALAGWRGGRSDFAVTRLIEVLSAIPPLLFAYLLVVRLGPSFWNILLAIGITNWIGLCRLTRGQFFALREKEYVEAARMIGASTWHIVWKHLIPNALGPLIVALTLSIPAAIFAEASLSFLGLGLNPPTPSWGQMLGRDAMQSDFTIYWHLAVFPALMIALTMLGFTLVGDGLQAVFAPETT